MPRGFHRRPEQERESLGFEARVTEEAHQSLRLWLRMMSCNMEIQSVLRRRLRAEFGMSLARFDYMAQAYRHPEGVSMRALSNYLMVTGGNVTGLTRELQKEGWVSRALDPQDRRSYLVRLTPEGRAMFESVATVHESWVVSLFADMLPADRARLTDLLGQVRTLLAQADLAQDRSNEPVAD